MEGEKSQKDSHSVIQTSNVTNVVLMIKTNMGTIQLDKLLPFTLLVCTIGIKSYQQISSIQTFQCSPARTCECRGQTETAEVREIGVSVETIRADL